jgi:hypothetical protein
MILQGMSKLILTLAEAVCFAGLIYIGALAWAVVP